MRPRSQPALGRGHQNPAVPPLPWSRNGADGRRRGGSGLGPCRSSLGRWSWSRLATRLSVVFALLFTTHLLRSQRNHHALASASSRGEGTVMTVMTTVSPKHLHRARARARRGFFFSIAQSNMKAADTTAAATAAASASVSGANAASASGADAVSASGADAASASGADAASASVFATAQTSRPSFARISAADGELVQKSKPASLVIAVPFTSKDASKVVDGLQKWSRPGDPCPIVRNLLSSSSSSSSSSPSSSSGRDKSSGISTSPVDVLFWFNRDLDGGVHARDASMIKKAFLEALEPVSHCFGRVEFKSANLSEDEDAYPFGPSNQWYGLFLSPERPLAPYDYAFWCEHDVAPVQPGWVDALLREATFPSGELFVKGSIHRGRKLDDIVIYPDKASWVAHINGNALYKANDPEFTAMISQCREANRGSESFLSSFDAAMWIQHVTSYASKWEKYQSYAHKFQYTDLIQNLNEDVSWPEGARDLVARSPNTFLVHGSSASAGEEHRKKTYYARGVAVDPGPAAKPLDPLPLPAQTSAEEKQLDELPCRPKAILPNKIAVVIPLIASQIEKLRVLFSLSSEEAFRPCDPEKVGGGKTLPIDLVFQISSTWLDESGTAGNEAYRVLSALVDEFPRFTSCFDKVHTRAANLSPSDDIHTANVFTGPNLQFRRMMNDHFIRSRFSHVLLLEPDATPIKRDWLERLWLEARSCTEESFWIKGTAYRGFRGDWVRNPAPYNITKVTSMWAAMNGNGIYNLQDPAFYEFMDRVWEAHPDLPFDGALHAYLFDVDNFEHTKRALTKIRYSSYVQNHGATRFDISSIRRESPETYIVHSSCRDEFPNKKTYCFVCDRDMPWSEDCQVKLNSDDVSLDYDRYTTGPTYRGPEISNANAEELWRAEVVV